MTRRHHKSPVRHSVRAHVRDGKRIGSYMRGHGSPSNIERRSSRFKRLSELTGGEPKPFTVNFKYSKKKGDGESVIVISRSYQKALDEAYEEKKDQRNPISVEIVDPDFGRIFKAIGSGLSKVTKVGAQYAIKGGHIAKQAAIRAKPHVKKGLVIAGKAGKTALVYSAKGIKVTGKAAAQAAARHYASKQLDNLIRDCYHENRVKRTRARSKLKREYADVYDVCDFSRDRSLTVRHVRVEKPPPAEKKPLPPVEVPPETVQEYEEKRIPA